jgi:aryl-alcohol dehydrogenase-like predicted oxidoreductase
MYQFERFLRFSVVKTSLSILLISALHTLPTRGFSVEKSHNVHSVHRIVFGTAALSKSENPLELLDTAYEKGFRRFDLARTYGLGESERIFGNWLKTRNIDRDDIDIITKGGMGMDRYGDPDRPLLTEDNLLEEVHDSMDTLNIDSIDLYMFHRDDERIGVDKFVQWVNGIVETGRIKRWGVSNWSFERFQAAYEYATENAYVPPSANSPQFSLAAPSCEIWPTTQSISQPEHVEHIRWYQEKNVELLCWEVLAKGFMAKSDLWPQDEVDESSFDKPVERGTDEWRVQRLQRAYCNPENYRRRDLAIKLADSSGLKLAQVAMLYPLAIGEHISVIFGSSKEDHLDDMISLQHLSLDKTAKVLLAGTQEEPEDTFADIPFLSFMNKSLSNMLNSNNSATYSKKSSFAIKNNE